MTQTERLALFLHASRPLLRRAQRTSPPPRPLVEAKKLEIALRGLSAPLRSLASSGELANVWKIAGLKRNEIRNASALAALWSPKLFPRTAPPFLVNFLDELPGMEAHSFREELADGYVVSTEEYPLGDSSNRVDISIEGPGTLIMIELKIDAVEGSWQLTRYRNSLDRKAQLLGKEPVLIILGPRAATTGVAIHAKWTDVSAAAQSVIRRRKSADWTFADHLLHQFAAHVSEFN